MTIDEALQIAQDIRNPDVVDSYKRVREALLALSDLFIVTPSPTKITVDQIMCAANHVYGVDFGIAHESYRTLA